MTQWTNENMTWGETLSKWTASLFFQDPSQPKWRSKILLSLFPDPFNMEKKQEKWPKKGFLCRAHKGYVVWHVQLKSNLERMIVQQSLSPAIHRWEGWANIQSNYRTLQSLLIIILRHKEKKRAPLGGLCRRKMWAFCCQKQFSSTLDNMRQSSNTAQWMVVDVTKPQVSKKNQQQINLGAFGTRALTDNPLAARATPRKPQIESFATHLLGTFAASWQIDRISLCW